MDHPMTAPKKRPAIRSKGIRRKNPPPIILKSSRPVSRRKKNSTRLAKALRYSRRATLLALFLLQAGVFLIFSTEPDQPPAGRGIFLDLYVDNRQHLVYAYLALISLAPVLTITHFITNPRRVRRRTFVYLSIIWALYASLIAGVVPDKFAAVAEVSWHYLLEPQLHEIKRIGSE